MTTREGSLGCSDATAAENTGSGPMRGLEDATAAGPFFLIVTGSPAPTSIGRVVKLSEAVCVIGRGQAADLRVDDDELSTEHARIEGDEKGGHRLVDLGSTTGTCVNGVPVRRAGLRDGDRIQIGRATSFRYSTRRRLPTREEQVLRALAASRAGTWEWHAEPGRLALAEDSQRLLGVSEPCDPLQLVHEDDRGRVIAALSQALSSGTCDISLRVVVPGRPVRWFSMCGEAVREEAGRPVRVVGALLDVTAHREAVEALRRQIAVFESISDGLVVLDMEGAILEWNRGAETMLAVGRGDAVGRTPGSIDGISWPGSVTDEMLRGVTREGIWRHEVKLRRRGGGSVAAEVVAAPVYDSQSRVCACVSIWRDLAERRRIEAHLQIADRMGGLWRIAAGLGHQLNNPLAALLSNLGWTQATLEALAIGDSEKAGILDVVRDMAESARQMAAVVRDLATMSRGARALDSGSADVKQVVELTARIALGELRSRAVVSCSLEPTPRVAMSEAHLGQVVQNILVEAAQRLEASRAANGQVVVATRAEGQDVTIEVRDNGPALTPEDIDHIFDPYYRTVIERPGSSLAMSVAFSLVEAAGGTLTVTSDAAGGNVVRARVPTLGPMWT